MYMSQRREFFTVLHKSSYTSIHMCVDVCAVNVHTSPYIRTDDNFHSHRSLLHLNISLLQNVSLYITHVCTLTAHTFTVNVHTSSYTSTHMCMCSQCSIYKRLTYTKIDLCTCHRDVSHSVLLSLLIQVSVHIHTHAQHTSTHFIRRLMKDSLHVHTLTHPHTS